MKSIYRRPTTGRNKSRMSFIDDSNIMEKIEKVSQRKMISQSELVRGFIHEGLMGWDC
jgi:hypothetical protein